MSWLGKAAQIAAPLIGGFLGDQAAGEQDESAQAQLDWIRQVYGNAQGNFQPYLQAGQGGLNGLSQLAAGNYSGFENSPDYQYARGEMVNGLDRSAASRGRLYSGGYGVDLAGHLNGLASQNLGQYRNSLQWLAGLGQNSAQSLGGIGTGTFGAMGSAYGQQADAAGNKYGSWAGAIGGLGNTLGNLYGSSSSYGNNSPGSSPYGYGGGGNAGQFGLPNPNPSPWWG